MCLSLNKQKSIEEIIAGNSAGMSDDQKAEYAYELYQQVFDSLSRVDDVESSITGVSSNIFSQVALAQYPSLTNWKIADWNYRVTTQEVLQKILSKDWTNKIKYSLDMFKCDKFAETLYDHLVLNYGIDTAVPVWGNTDQGYHGFNLAILFDPATKNYYARLVEPQTDAIFVDTGPLGKYTPDQSAVMLGINRPDRGLKGVRRI